MVCAEPRSGSSLLCELLCDTELAGAPTEFFDREMMERFQEVWGAPSLERYLGALMRKKTGPNGVFGFKVHYEQFSDVLAGSDIDSMFGDLRLVHIGRRDRVRQAVSFARAIQTNQWASDHPARGAPAFDRDLIASCQKRIERVARGWERFFAERSASPLRIVYEDFAARPQETVEDVLRHLGVEFPAGLDLRPPTLDKQADSLSEQWVRRYG